MRTGTAVLLLSSTVLATACGPTCRDTCVRVFAEDQCDARPAGTEPAVVINSCVLACETAMKVPGPAPRDDNPAFDPTKPYVTTASAAVAVQNQNEAAAWMDCVWTFESVSECREMLGSGGQRCALVQSPTNL